MSDLQDAIDYYDRTDHPPMPAVDPLVETARLVADPLPRTELIEDFVTELLRGTPSSIRTRPTLRAQYGRWY